MLIFRAPPSSSCHANGGKLKGRDRRKHPKVEQPVSVEPIMWFDVAPNFYPSTIGVWTSVMPCWAVVAAVREAEPSVERSAADRRCAA